VPMLMPKATVDKYTGSQPWQYNVRVSRKIFSVDAKSIALGMQKFSDDQFRGSVFTFDPPHHAGPGGLINDVHFPFLYSVVS
jgi:hypothetical protein